MKRPRSTTVVLGLLCVMYLITYVDRVNIATAASEIRRDLGLSNTRLGLALSAFGYPYLLFQIFGGWIGDRVGPRRTLFLCGVIWAAATMLTGLAGGLLTLFLVRVLLGVGEGATFPVATRAMQTWTPPGRRGFAQGITHAFARFGNMITPPIVAWLIALLTWRGSFVMLGCFSLMWVVGGFLGSFLTLLPIVLTHDLRISVVCLSIAFFFAELVIGPMWAIPMDIAPKYSGTAAGIMNSGSALAAILSPLVFGYVADVTGDWHLPFIGSLALLLLGAALAFTMHPEQPLHASDLELQPS